FRDPDHAVAIDDQLVDASFGIGQDEVLLRAGARIELHQPVRIAAVDAPDVAFGVELRGVHDAVSGEGNLTLRLDAGRGLTRRVRLEEVLDELRLPELGLVERYIAVRAHRPRLAVGPE